MLKRAQVNVEVLGAAIIIMGLLVLVLVTVYQRDAEAGRIADAGMNSIQCNKISGAISNLHNNRATSEQSLLIDRNAGILKIGAGPGQISVGGISCNYLGVVSGEATGLGLAAGKTYKFSKSNSEVHICEMPC